MRRDTMLVDEEREAMQAVVVVGLIVGFVFGAIVGGLVYATASIIGCIFG